MTKKLKRNIKRIVVGTVILIIAAAVTKKVNIYIGIGLFAVSYLILSLDVMKRAFNNIVHGHVFDEAFLMIIATIGAWVLREYDEAVFVMLFYQVGETFQSYAVNKSRKSIKALMEIRPDFARVIRNGEETEVSPEEVRPNESIVVRAGERIPLDGKIIHGNTSLDTSAITGESIPEDVGPGDEIASGCVNLSGVITVKVEREYEKSTVSRILYLVEEASEKKGKAEQFITTFARVYTPIIVGLASGLIFAGSLITGDWATWLYRGLTFLLISCPCALVISIPLSFFGGIGGAGRSGILIKGGNYIDVLSKVDTLVLDKTGTITSGMFSVSSVETVRDTFSGEELLKYAALAERNSNHPIGISIVKAYGKDIPETLAGDVIEVAGRGIEAHIEGHTVKIGNRKYIGAGTECLTSGQGGTVIYVSIDGEYSGHIHITDDIKPGTEKALMSARRAGIKTIVMLTGDNTGNAERVAKLTGIERFMSELSPLDKVNAVEDIILKKSGGKVAFAGDGINDAPVLARADIGIAMGAMGSDAAIEAADIVIMNDDLGKIALAKEIAVKTLRIVRENIILALGVKVIVLILAAWGIASMWMAIFADVGVAFLAIMNALRALGVKEKQNEKKIH